MCFCLRIGTWKVVLVPVYCDRFFHSLFVSSTQTHSHNASSSFSSKNSFYYLHSGREIVSKQQKHHISTVTKQLPRLHYTLLTL